MKSMTGFSEGRFELAHMALHVSFRSWNHRFLEVNFKGSGMTPESEKLIKEIIKDQVHRGKIEIFCDLVPQDKSKYTVQLNESLLSEIMDKLVDFKQKYNDQINLSLDALLKIPLIFRLDYAAELFDEKDIHEIRSCIEKVFTDFLHSREVEGRATAEKLIDNCRKIEMNLECIKNKADQVEKEIFARFKEKMLKYLSEVDFDERRLIQEAAIMAERGCIQEEIHRLETHTKRLKALVHDTHCDVKGKELDFLAQEMMRETHTIAAKTDSMDIHAQVLEMRREIEKIKQQVQNVE